MTYLGPSFERGGTVMPLLVFLLVPLSVVGLAVLRVRRVQARLR